jgi:hypothetical protein
MTRVLKRPMFRLGGNTDQGIMSGVAPRQGYDNGKSVKSLDDLRGLTIPQLKEVAESMAYRPRGVTPADALIEFGLNVASAKPTGSIFSTAAGAAQEPFQRYSKSKAESEAARYVSEADMFKTLIGAQADILGGEGGAKWQKQFEAEQIPGLVNRISELEGSDDLSDAEKNELRSKRIILNKYSPEDPTVKWFLGSGKDVGAEKLFKKIKNDLWMADQESANPKYDPKRGEDDPQLIADTFLAFKKYLTEDLKATGGRVGYQEAGPVMGQPTQADAMPEELGGVSYEELRARLPQDVSDEVVRLLANSPEALEDFAVIQTEQDIANFNKKYGVNLVLPAEA